MIYTYSLNIPSERLLRYAKHLQDRTEFFNSCHDYTTSFTIAIQRPREHWPKIFVYEKCLIAHQPYSNKILVTGNGTTESEEEINEEFADSNFGLAINKSRGEVATIRAYVGLNLLSVELSNFTTADLYADYTVRYSYEYSIALPVGMLA